MLRKKLKLRDINSEDQSQVPDSAVIKNPPKNRSETVPEVIVVFEPAFWEKIWKVEQDLARELLELDFKKDKNIAAVYNPLDYAAEVHINFMKKFLKKAPEVLFLGMNPGLFGMCQTSVPFGHVPSVRDWMKISGQVNKPEVEIASKPIEGFNCQREERSGKRFWGVLEELCGEPENFFRHCFVYNICPLAFLNGSGRNITPPEIKCQAKSELTKICLNYLAQVIKIFNPKIIISVGSYANDRVKDLKRKNLISDTIDCKLIPHPSPRALNNQDWVEKAKKWYIDNDIVKFFNDG